MNKIKLKDAEALSKVILERIHKKDFKNDGALFIVVDDFVISFSKSNKNLDEWITENEILKIPIPQKHYNPDGVIKVMEYTLKNIPSLLIHEATHLLQRHDETSISTFDLDIWLTDPYEMNAVHNEWLYCKKHNKQFHYDDDPEILNQIIMSLELFGYTDIPSPK